MNTAMRFRINSPKVILESFDDEVVIVNLDSGNYYSLDKIGSDIWSFLEKGASLHETVSAVKGMYLGDPDAISMGVTRLVEALLAENIIVSDASESSSRCREASLAGNGKSGEKPAFANPVLSKYTDMQDLLLLDPIHDVDETGWPKKAEAG
ncbi:MAG: PqqD family protein [Geobacteraceae bacterium]|nr:PqqD family protein [Geobacteraceae bacterium]